MAAALVQLALNSIEVQMKIARILFYSAFFLMLSFQCRAGEKGGESARFLVSVSNGLIHLYIANEGSTDLAADYRIDPSGLGYAINFRFYRKDGYCKECKYTPDEDFVSRMPLFYKRGDISPSEIAGVSFPVDFIAERYALRSGCYGFFVGFTRRNGSVVVARHASNASSICLPEKAVRPGKQGSRP